VSINVDPQSFQEEECDERSMGYEVIHECFNERECPKCGATWTSIRIVEYPKGVISNIFAD
jgi:hypothetical protein